MKISIETITKKLFEAIEEKNAHRTLAFVLELKESVRTDPVAVKWIADPTNLKRVHDALVEHLDVPPKAMMIKNRIPHRQRRALMFVEGIENGVRRIV